MIAPLRKVKTAIEDLRQFQSSVENVINVFRSKQLIDGRLISGISIKSGTPYNLNHGLDQVRGWVVARKNAESDVWETAGSTSRSIVLNSSSDVEVSIWIF